MKTFKKILASLMVAVMVLTAAPLSGFVGMELNLDWLSFDWLDFNTKASAASYSGTCGDNLSWSLDTSIGELVISGEGEMDDYSSTYINGFYRTTAPWSDYISSSKKVTIEDGVTSIGSCAFYGCTSLTSITIPDGVTSIGSSAFRDCTSLTSIAIPDSVTSIGSDAFYNTGYYNDSSNWEDDVLYIGSHLIKANTSISGAYTIKEGTMSIGPYAFESCTNLTSITIPDSVTSINYYVFKNCSGLKELTMPISAKIHNNTFYGCNDIEKITLTKGNGTAQNYATSTGNSETYYQYTPWYISECSEIVIEDGVTGIGSYAFYDCDSLTSITIPDSVTSIGDSVFEGCTSLTSITIPDSVTSIGYSVFEGCTSLTRITISDSVTSISYSAFWGCSNLTSITIPDSVTSIGSSAFSWCESLTSVTIPDSVTSIGDGAFEGCTSLTSITIPDSVTSIGNYAFYNCSGIKELTMPISAKIYNSNYTFGGCTNIEKITLTKGNGTAQNYATLTGYSETSFQFTPWYISECSEIVIEDGVTGTGSYAFRDCTSLTSITIPDSVTSIGDGAFRGCTSLTSITIPDSVTSIGDSAFYNCRNLTSITIGNSVTSIGDFAFSDCTSLTSITIPDSVTSIGYCAFWNCSGLADVSIGDGVTSIGSSAFSDCTSLTSITIGNNVTSIGTNAFSNCEKLEEVTFTGDSIVEFGEEIFYGSPKAMICCEENSWLHFYASSNGMRFCLLDDDKLPAFEIKNNVLVSYRGASENVSVSIVNQIGYGAFEGNSTVENIEIAKSVNVIYNNAFKNCSALKSVYIPQSVTSIGATAFNGCDDVTIWCYAGSYADEYAQTYDIDVEYITLSIDDSIIYLSPNEQTTVTYSLNTHLADNMSVVWESTDKTIVTVDSFGNIKGIKAGTAVIVVASKDGTMRDYCVVKVVGIEALSTLSIDFESGIISGLSSNTTSLDGLITMTDSSCNLSYTTLGTDSVVYVERDNEIVDAYTILIYGDVNGDSWYDGQDAIIVDCLANGMLTQNDVSEAVYTAADCNHDGVIDQLDVEILNQAGTLLSNVDQSKPAEVLLETSSAYVEYLDLIDQSPEIEVENETDAPETDAEDSDPIEENGIFTFIFDLVAFLKNFFNFIFSFINL